jgi:alkanesulfonate monooxygenase SsuD/methylene tetrahydromethanopterin reductase-like flavin-dependent oxidoreductase (luciferase family)
VPPTHTAPPRLGITFLTDEWTALSPARRRALQADMEAGGVDHMVVPDHVSFRDGWGADGFVGATSVLSGSDRLGAYLGVYLLALRHPVPVARQIITLCQLHPGRLTLGIGVGGDDRHEVISCGVDPATRGARTDESLAVLRQLLAGEPVTHHGRFFDLDDVVVQPAPDPAVPIIIGGRADAALRRAGRYGDGWLGIYVSAERFAQATEPIAAAADDAGRTHVAWQHALSVWCGFGGSATEAEAHVGSALTALYGMPYDAFRKWAPAGTPEQVAEFLVPYWEAGCSVFNLVPQAGGVEAGLEAVIATWQHFRKQVF